LFGSISLWGLGMTKVGKAIILASCATMAVLFLNYTPVVLDQRAEDTYASRTLAQAIGAAVTLARSQNTCWSNPAENSCQNDLKETNSIQVSAENCGFSMVKGTLKISTATGIPVHCGHAVTLNGITLQGQVVNSEREPSATTGIVIDHAVKNGSLANFDNAAILPTVRSGYGFSVHYDSQTNIQQVDLAEHMQTNDKNSTDQTVLGSAHMHRDQKGIRIDEASFTVYQNVLQLIGKSQLKDLTFNDSCCTPISGTITTQFISGNSVAPSDQGARFVGKSETLTFNGCGKARLRSQIPVSCL
jgi:hypothetical protein